MSDTLREALTRIVVTYDEYRRRGVAPAPREYRDVVLAIDAARAALAREPAAPANDLVTRLEWEAKGWSTSTMTVGPEIARLYREAADRIEKLQAERDAFRRDWHKAMDELAEARNHDLRAEAAEGVIAAADAMRAAESSRRELARRGLSRDHNGFVADYDRVRAEYATIAAQGAEGK